MRADFANALAGKLNIQRRDLIEKDIILHQILLDLSKDKFFSWNFVFKGGTCLIKCYYGYKRFSEDIDFTWKKQNVFRGKSQKGIRDYLSDVINKTGAIFERIAEKRGLEFRCKKNDRNFVELGGSNKFCTFKIWYDSEILGRKSFIKVQINFVEQFCLRPRKGRLNSLLVRQDPELKALYPEYKEYVRAVSFDIYDLREILSEKTRALLTRRGTKARDFLDVYLIYKHYGMKPEDVEECIMTKINFALKLYARFRYNLKEKMKLLESGNIFDWGQERRLLLSEIDEKDFYLFLDEFQTFLKRIVKIINFKQ
ncbi:MAG: nucleotidyl transferase AbiEii/AbiGii toxin family protein [Nitrososphaerota archaeon]